jgi:hypothetical protein
LQSLLLQAPRAVSLSRIQEEELYFHRPRAEVLSSSKQNMRVLSTSIQCLLFQLFRNLPLVINMGEIGSSATSTELMGCASIVETGTVCGTLGGNEYPLGSRVACYIGVGKIPAVVVHMCTIWMEYYSIPCSTYYID